VVRAAEGEELRAAGDDVKVIEVFPEYRAGLKGAEEASRLQVLYWMHQLKESDREILLVHPQGDTSRPKRGVFVLRSPMRPNPIGSTEVEVRHVSGGRLIVSALDALVGSPVIDIKIAR